MFTISFCFLRISFVSETVIRPWKNLISFRIQRFFFVFTITLLHMSSYEYFVKTSWSIIFINSVHEIYMCALGPDWTDLQGWEEARSCSVNGRGYLNATSGKTFTILVKSSKLPNSNNVSFFRLRWYFFIIPQWILIFIFYFLFVLNY